MSSRHTAGSDLTAGNAEAESGCRGLSGGGDKSRFRPTGVLWAGMENLAPSRPCG